MWNHGPEMWELMEKEGISFPNFAKGEMADALAYLYEINLIDEPGDPRKGEKVLHEKSCLSCHSVRGKGGHVAKKDLGEVKEIGSPMAMIAAMWNHAGEMQKRVEEKDLKWPKLDGTDMANIHAYLTAPPD
jgi:cytochrome c